MFIHSSMDGHLVCFYPSVVVNIAAVTKTDFEWVMSRVPGHSLLKEAVWSGFDPCFAS